MSQNEQQFTNPYALTGEYNPEEHGRVQADMPREAKQFIISLRPIVGTPQTVINILWSKLITALKENGITNFTQQSDFCSFVANIKLVDGRTPGSAPNRPVSEATAPNVPRGTPRVAGKDKKQPRKQRIVAGTSGSGS